MTASHVFFSTTLEQTMAIGRAVARCAAAGDIIGLRGELGAGKTQFVRGMAQGLGIDAHHVASPTFVISHEYDPEREGTPVLVHIDAYRLTGPDDLGPIGWGEGGEEIREGAIVAIEWADRIADALGDDRLDVKLEHTADGRRITLTPHGTWTTKLQNLDIPAHA